MVCEFCRISSKVRVGSVNITEYDTNKAGYTGQDGALSVINS